MSAAARLRESDAYALQECVAAGGVALFPADTVYGLACDPRSAAAIDRLYALKGRTASKPAAVMFFSLPAALAELVEGLAPGALAAARALLPGPVTLLLANPRWLFPLACAPAGVGRPRANLAAEPPPLGLRVPAWPPALAALEGVGVPVMQSSANLAGGSDARALADVPEPIMRGVDLVLDGGRLPGIASTVIDLSRIDRDGAWRIVREGAFSRGGVEHALAGRPAGGVVSQGAQP